MIVDGNLLVTLLKIGWFNLKNKIAEMTSLDKRSS